MVTLPLTEHAATYLDCCSAFPAEMLLEESGPEIVDEGDRELLRSEEEMIDSLPLPHASAGEDRRRAEWSRLPQNIRAAIRRLHRQFGHPPQ
eukprot:3486475-Amphidinium_carterae.1